MKPPEIREKMENLKTFIQDAEASVANGTMVDLTGLDRDIALICNKTVALPPEEARNLQPLMAELIGSLESLSRTLKDFRDGLKK